MKAKLMALLLAVGLGVAGVAATVQAAEVGTHAVTGCAHVYKKVSVFRGATDYNNMYHKSRYDVTFQCEHCPDYYESYEEVFEIHDYENIYLDNGRIVSICNGCGARTEG